MVQTIFACLCMLPYTNICIFNTSKTLLVPAFVLAHPLTLFSRLPWYKNQLVSLSFWKSTKDSPVLWRCSLSLLRDTSIQSPVMCSLWLPTLWIQTYTQWPSCFESESISNPLWSFPVPKSEGWEQWSLKPLSWPLIHHRLLKFFLFHQILEFISIATNSELSKISYPEHLTSLRSPSCLPFTVSLHPTSSRMLLKCSRDFSVCPRETTILW